MPTRSSALIVSRYPSGAVFPLARKIPLVAGKYFICIEPYIGRDKKAKEEAKRDYSYFWDYPKLFKQMGAKIVEDSACALADAGLGPYYRLYVVEPKRL
jgi:hypothetical protein